MAVDAVHEDTGHLGRWALLRRLVALPIVTFLIEWASQSSVLRVGRIDRLFSSSLPTLEDPGLVSVLVTRAVAGFLAYTGAIFVITSRILVGAMMNTASVRKGLVHVTHLLGRSSAKLVQSFGHHTILRLNGEASILDLRDLRIAQA